MAIFSRKKPKPTSHAPTTNGNANGMTNGVAHASAHDQRVLALGTELLDRARNAQAGLRSARVYQDKLMDWSMKDQRFKTELFRFVDTFPVLRTPEAVHEHLSDYLTQEGVTLPPGLGLGLKAGGLGVFKGAMTGTISSQIKSMAGNFIAGTDAADALPKLKKLWDRGIAFSVDLLGEACVADSEADAYRDKYLDLVTNLPETVSGWAANERLEHDHLGPLARTNVSVKLSSLSAKADPIDSDGAIRDVMTRLGPVLDAARERGVFINFDMEDHDLKELTLAAFFHACETHEFEAGLAMQAYLRSGVDDAKRVCEWAKRTGKVVTVRLVKGAYWDFETIHAELMGWPCPVWSRKWETDRCFEQMVDVFLDNCPRAPGEPGVKLALGSHNARSIAHTLAGMESRGLSRDSIELQMLHDMADQLKDAAEEMGLRVREYVPVGEMIPGMAYLVRRLLENTSNESWLRAGFVDEADVSVLLAEPGPGGPKSRPEPEPGDPGHPTEPMPSFHELQGDDRQLHEIGPERHGLSPAVPGVGDGRPFFSEPFRDFSEASQRRAFAQQLESTAIKPLAHLTHNKYGELLATSQRAHGDVTWAHEASLRWTQVAPERRAQLLVDVAADMRAQRDALAGAMVREAGKPWREADADVCEAIDFCEYYARLAPQLFERARLGRFIGELDEVWYQPRGVAAVISPWNFPLAIATGMTAAAVVTGNSVVVKPAEQTPSIAKTMVELFQTRLSAMRSGPEDNDLVHVVELSPGDGETIGAALVRDPRVSVIAFTGSKAVGLDIIRAASEVDEDAGQGSVKKVIAEMGGKNAIIIDTSADLDEAVLGVRYSAFGFSGQKCSACSRCIVVDPEGEDGPAMRAFLTRLVESTKSLVLGDPMEPGTDVGPVIDDEAAANIRAAIEQATVEVGQPMLRMDDVTLAAESPTIPKQVIGPTIFAGVKPTHQLARKEVFGPVLAVMHAASFEEALRIANDHPYKLTGGVFTRKPTHIERAKREFRVGNLYINRGCTGALVGRHPFGGFGMSGVGSKAGGSDYLLQFVEPRACAENTMRRGFAPEL
ncbi:MAG: proline dehydrogenase family protein [Planctomycetota bacterium]